jgi:hypothetical protein
MVVGASSDYGQNVQLNVEEEFRSEPGYVTTSAQLMVAETVSGKVFRLNPVILLLVQVK